MNYRKEVIPTAVEGTLSPVSFCRCLVGGIFYPQTTTRTITLGNTLMISRDLDTRPVTKQ